MSQAFTVRGKLTAGDFLPAIKYIFWRSRAIKVLFALGCFYGIIVIAGLVLDPQSFPITNLIWPPALLIILTASPYLSLRTQMKKAPVLLEEGEFILDEEGFRVVRQSFGFNVNWPATNGVVEFPGQFAIYTSKIHVQVIAKRFFESAEVPVARAFLERVLKENGKTFKIIGR